MKDVEMSPGPSCTTTKDVFARRRRRLIVPQTPRTRLHIESDKLKKTYRTKRMGYRFLTFANNGSLSSIQYNHGSAFPLKMRINFNYFLTTTLRNSWDLLSWIIPFKTRVFFRVYLKFKVKSAVVLIVLLLWNAGNVLNRAIRVLPLTSD